MEQKSIAVIGAGAAGLSSAIEALRMAKSESFPVSVTLFEKLPKAAKKLLVTGNGRCNFTNDDLSDKHFYGDTAFLKYLKDTELFDAKSFFASMGLLTYTESGRVYPRSEQASSVRDALLRTATVLGAVFRTESPVTEIAVSGRKFLVKNEAFDSVILACGGKSAPSQGTDGTSYDLLKSLGHTISPVFPALTGLECRDKALKELKGVRARGVLRLLDGKKELGRDTGELQFNESGLSGIPTLQLSHLAGGRKGLTASIDFFPEKSEDELKRFLADQKYKHPMAETEDILAGIVNRKIGFSVMARAKIRAHENFGQLDVSNLLRLAHLLKNFEFEINGPCGFENAQISCGGAKLTDFDPGTLMSKKAAGFFACGEALNLHGDCGGYNLHLAWAEGRTAGKSAVQYLIGETSFHDTNQ